MYLSRLIIRIFRVLTLAYILERECRKARELQHLSDLLKHANYSAIFVCRDRYIMGDRRLVTVSIEAKIKYI